MNDRRIGRLAWVMAWVGLVVGQFHAMARHQTVDGKEDLEVWTTRVWSDPARDCSQASARLGEPRRRLPDLREDLVPGVRRVHRLCASCSTAAGGRVGFEKFAWRLALVGYTWACVAVLVTYWTQWTHETTMLDLAFVFLDIPGLLLSVIGSTMLGITLIRRGYRPRVTGWLLALSLPLSIVIGHVHLDGQRCAARRCSPSASRATCSPGRRDPAAPAQALPVGSRPASA